MKKTQRLLVALFAVAFLVGISGAVQVDIVSPIKYVVTAVDMEAVIEPTSITTRSLRWQSSNSTNSLRISLSNIDDNIWWRSSPNPGTCTNSHKIQRFPFANTTLSHYAGPNSTTIVEIATPHGSGCTLRILFFFADTLTHVSVGNYEIPIYPSSLKFSILTNCSWQDNIQIMPDKPAPGVTPWVRGRRMFLSILLTSISQEAATPIYGAGPGWATFPTFRQWVEDVCATQNMSITPPSYRPMPESYDPFAFSSVTLQYPYHNRTLEFLPWSLVDSGTIVRTTASSNGSIVSEVTPEGFLDTLNMVVQLEFYKNLTYDPTISLVFAMDPEAPGSDNNASIQFAVNIAAAVAVPVVVVVIAVAILAAVVIKRQRHAAERASIASKISRSISSSHLEGNNKNNNTIVVDQSASADERRGTWTAARTPSIA